MKTNQRHPQKNAGLFAISCLSLVAVIGCATTSNVSAEKSTYLYAASYTEVVDYLKGNGGDFKMKYQKEEAKGVLVFSVFRAGSLLTMSTFNMLSGGDKVTITVTEKGPTITAVNVTSYGKGQVGPDFGRNNKNVRLVLDALARKFQQIGTEKS